MNPNNIRIRIRSRKHYSLTSDRQQKKLIASVFAVYLREKVVMCCFLAKKKFLIEEKKLLPKSLRSKG